MFGTQKKGTQPEQNDLGFLERETMEHVWKLGESSVAQVHDELKGRLAYTTVMTTLDRLYKKGLLQRRKQGRAFIYTAKLSKGEFKESLIKKALRFLLEENKNEPVPLMANLVETFREHDTRLLDELEKLIQKSKRDRNREVK
jgi:predicted transcriptional regulator